VKGREEILGVHAKSVKLGEGVDMGVIARGTPGYSGAELANVINEAALLAARKGLKAITTAELEEARDKVRWGKERRSLALSEDEKKLTAYHEAGHALLGMLVKDTDPVHKVSIIPRGPALGVTMYLPVEDKHSYKKQYLLDRLILIMGGRVAEELVFGDVTNGAAGDIRQASEIARKMVCNWGMSEKLGMIEYGEGQGEVFLARDISSPRNYSEATAQQIDDEVRGLTDEAYSEATRLLTEHRDKLEAIAQALLEYETLDGSHIDEIMEHGEIQNPPTTPTPPDLPEEAESNQPPVGEEEKNHGDDFPGELAPAGA
jgi:cell division protease FtsH